MIDATDARSLVIAVVDIGTNTLKFSVARCSADGSIFTILERAETVRLGAGIEQTGHVDPERAERALVALKVFEAIGIAEGATVFTGVATEALRVARNGKEILDRIAVETCWSVAMIPGDEEARLTFVGLRSSLPERGMACIVDIGGGSTEWIVTENRVRLSAVSLPIGSGRLSDRHFRNDPPGLEAVEAARIDAFDFLAAHVPSGGVFTLLLSGGNGQFLDQLREEFGVDDALSGEVIEHVLRTAAETPSQEIAELLGIQVERARVLPAGIAIAAAAVQHIQPQTVMAVPSGIRTGLMIEVSAAWLSQGRNAQLD